MIIYEESSLVRNFQIIDIKALSWEQNPNN